DELALLVLEMPGRIGAAGPDDQMSAIENGAQEASFRGLRVSLLRRDSGCQSRCSCQAHAGSQQERTSIGFLVAHDCLPFQRRCPPAEAAPSLSGSRPRSSVVLMDDRVIGGLKKRQVDGSTTRG